MRWYRFNVFDRIVMFSLCGEDVNLQVSGSKVLHILNISAGWKWGSLLVVPTLSWDKQPSVCTSVIRSERCGEPWFLAQSSRNIIAVPTELSRLQSASPKPSAPQLDKVWDDLSERAPCSSAAPGGATRSASRSVAIGSRVWEECVSECDWSDMCHSC